MCAVWRAVIYAFVRKIHSGASFLMECFWEFIKNSLFYQKSKVWKSYLSLWSSPWFWKTLIFFTALWEGLDWVSRAKYKSYWIYLFGSTTLLIVGRIPLKLVMWALHLSHKIVLTVGNLILKHSIMIYFPLVICSS